MRTYPLILFGLLVGLTGSLLADVPKELKKIKEKVVHVPTLDVKDKNHHDPSNIIRHEGLYYLYYTEHPRPTNGWEGVIRYSTSKDGLKWTTGDIVIPRGSEGEIDDEAAITSYIVPHKGKFYLFYTAFGGDVRGITYAVAESPKGPFVKSGEKILWPSGNKKDWDGVHIDDANIIYYGGKWMFYYKGRPDGKSAEETKIGVAVSDSLLGPYVKYENNPVFDGHAFTAWVHREGVAAFGFGTFWSEDGFKFEKVSEWTPKTVGVYCPQNFGNGVNNMGVSWGMKVMFPGTRGRYIARMELPSLKLADTVEVYSDMTGILDRQFIRNPGLNHRLSLSGGRNSLQVIRTGYSNRNNRFDLRGKQVPSR